MRFRRRSLWVREFGFGVRPVLNVRLRFGGKEFRTFVPGPEFWIGKIV